MSNPSWTDVLNELNRDVSKEKPSDVVQWGADWFQARLKRDRSSNMSGSRGAFGASAHDDVAPHAQSPSDTGPSGNPFAGASPTATRAGPTIASGSTLFTSPFGGSGTDAPARESSPFSAGAAAGAGAAVAGGAAAAAGGLFANSSPFGGGATNVEDHPDEPQVPQYALGRRTSVSAESLVPANQRKMAPPSAGLETTLEEDEDATPNPAANAMPSFPKTPEQLQRIRTAIKPNFLFANLDEEQEADVLAAMKEVELKAGETVIEQGAAGDYFYVVESGKLEVFVKKDGLPIDVSKGDSETLGKKVVTYDAGASFGELALMHNAPRAATVVSINPCTLWALDRVSFRTILLDHTSRKRRLYENFLAEVPILASLQPQERAKIADVLESRTYEPGQNVIVEGEAGEEFFLIESGSAEAVKKDAGGNETVLKQLNKGDYFGELALLNRQTRAATVRPAGNEKLRVAALGEQAFTRLLGPVKDIMARSVSERYGSSAAR